MKKIYSFVILTENEDDLIFIFDDEESFKKGLEEMKDKYGVNTITHECEVDDDEYELLKDKISNKIYSLEKKSENNNLENNV
jgi:hypothetical protein